MGAIQDILKNTKPEKNAFCEKHGEYLSRNPIGNIWTPCPKCQQEKNDQEKALQHEAALRKKREQWLERLGNCAIPQRHQKCRLKNYEVHHAKQQKALSFAVTFAKSFSDLEESNVWKPSGKCAFFLGSCGTGKTHLACAIAWHIVHFYNRSALFTSVSKLNRRIREAKSFNSKETESEAIKIFTDPDLLIIDEIGMQSFTEAESRALFDVLNERYEQQKSTIFISNLDYANVAQILGHRLVDRFKEDGAQNIIFNWESFREKGN